MVVCWQPESIRWHLEAKINGTQALEGDINVDFPHLWCYKQIRHPQCCLNVFKPSSQGQHAVHTAVVALRTLV